MNKVETLSVNEVMETILVESKRVANKMAAKLGKSFDDSELYSFLVYEVYNQIVDKTDFHNIRGIRSTINLYTLNFIKTESRFNNQTVFSSFARKDEYGEGHSFEETLTSDDIPIAEQFALSSDLDGFIHTLTERQRQILELVTEGYGTNDICEMLNISINTPKNTMKKIRQLALQYGL